MDVSGAHNGHRIQRRQVPHVRTSTRPGHGLAHLDVRSGSRRPSISSPATAPMVRRASDDGRCARTAITIRSTAASSSWRRTTGITSKACIPRRASSGSTSTTTTAGRSPSAKVKDIQARVVTKETFDPATRKTTELSAFPLKAARNRPYLEARIDPSTLPAEMTAKVKFGGDQPEYRFDFTFASFSKEPAAPAVRPSVTQPLSPPTPPAAPAPTAPAVARPSVDPAHAGADSDVDERHARAARASREKQVGELIARGDFAAVWVPAFQAKDIAIALEPHVASSGAADSAMPASRRWRVSSARRGCSMPPGTSGNRAQIEAVYAAFKTAVADVLAAFGEVPMTPRTRTRRSRCHARRDRSRVHRRTPGARTSRSPRRTPTTTMCFRSCATGAGGAT